MMHNYTPDGQLTGVGVVLKLLPITGLVPTG